MIKPEELHEYMLSQMTNEQKKHAILFPVIVKRIIKAVIDHKRQVKGAASQIAAPKMEETKRL